MIVIYFTTVVFVIIILVDKSSGNGNMSSYSYSLLLIVEKRIVKHVEEQNNCQLSQIVLVFNVCEQLKQIKTHDIAAFFFHDT